MQRSRNGASRGGSNWALGGWRLPGQVGFWRFFKGILGWTAIAMLGIRERAIALRIASQLISKRNLWRLAFLQGLVLRPHWGGEIGACCGLACPTSGAFWRSWLVLYLVAERFILAVKWSGCG